MAADENVHKDRLLPSINTAVALIALLISGYTLRMQIVEKRQKHAQVLSYEVGTQRIDDKQFEDWFKIYNFSEGDIYLESVRLKANLGDGVYDQVDLYEPTSPRLLHPGEFKAFRFRMNYVTDQDSAEEKNKYQSYTGSSTVEARTTEDRILTFETSYHPIQLDRIRVATLGKPYLDQDFIVLSPLDSHPHAKSPRKR